MKQPDDIVMPRPSPNASRALPARHWWLVPALVLGCGWLGCATNAVAQDAAVKQDLERAYEKWRSAMQAKDPLGWAASISMYRQVVTRNLIVSQRQAFPGAVFAVPMTPPDISQLRLLEAQAVGPTAHLLLFGKVDIGDAPDKIPDNILMLKFFKEKDVWKFDSSRMMNLESSPQVREALQRGQPPDFLDNPEFTPPGVVPPVPALCNPPENMAGSTLQSYGYETRMRINGFDYPLMKDQAEKMFIIGGLNNGRNEVTLTVKPHDIPAGEERLLQLDLFVFTGAKDKPSVRVYHYESKDANPPPVIKLPVVIDSQVLRDGR